MRAERRAAWDAYLVISVGLLPALARQQVAARAEFTALVALLTASAVMWPDGYRLVAVAARAEEMHRAGDSSGAGELLRALARRLFAMSGQVRSGTREADPG